MKRTKVTEAQKNLPLFIEEEHLLIEPVPERFALKDNLYQISVIGRTKYTFAGQWTAQEVSIMQTVVKAFNWHLDENDGCPVELWSIYEALEETHDEKLYPLIHGLKLNTFCRTNWNSLRLRGRSLLMR